MTGWLTLAEGLQLAHVSSHTCQGKACYVLPNGQHPLAQLSSHHNHHCKHTPGRADVHALYQQTPRSLMLSLSWWCFGTQTVPAFKTKHLTFKILLIMSIPLCTSPSYHMYGSQYKLYCIIESSLFGGIQLFGWNRSKTIK